MCFIVRLVYVGYDRRDHRCMQLSYYGLGEPDSSVTLSSHALANAPERVPNTCPKPACTHASAAHIPPEYRTPPLPILRSVACRVLHLLCLSAWIWPHFLRGPRTVEILPGCQVDASLEFVVSRRANERVKCLPVSDPRGRCERP